MGKIKTYSEFIKEEIESIDNVDIFNSFLESFFNSNLITIDERELLISELYNPIEYIINENFFDKLKTRFDKAKEVSKEMSDKAKSALEKIVDASKKATDFVIKIKEFLVQQISNILGSVKDKLKSKFKADTKLMSKIKEVANAEKNALVSELKICKDVVQFYTKEFKDKFVSQISSALTNFLSSEDNSEPKVSESLINEANMIGKLVDGLSHIPPFSWLHQVQHMGEKGAQHAISVISNITKNLGGPEIFLPVIAAVLGIAFEYNVKGLVKHGLLHVIETYAIPFIGIIVKLLGYIATFIAVVDLFDEITSSNIVREEGMDDLHH
jgi:F0F1-type ATP synthase membrane subunit b/b'